MIAFILDSVYVDLTNTKAPAMNDVVQATEEDRELKPAVLKGLRLKCPNCGKGDLLHSYLKVNDECSNCLQPLHYQRADDGPAYLTILLVGHFLGFGLHFSWVAWRPDPWVLAIAMSIVSVGAALLMLPRMKGMIVAYQWAKRLHGF